MGLVTTSDGGASSLTVRAHEEHLLDPDSISYGNNESEIKRKYAKKKIEVSFPY